MEQVCSSAILLRQAAPFIVINMCLNVFSHFIKYNSIIFIIPIKEVQVNMIFFHERELSGETQIGYIINLCVPLTSVLLFFISYSLFYLSIYALIHRRLKK